MGFASVKPIFHQEISGSIGTDNAIYFALETLQILISLCITFLKKNKTFQNH